MTDLTHLNALNLRLSHERVRLDASRTAGERASRQVWVAGIEREIAQERVFLGLGEAVATPEMTDDELLAELAS